MKPGEGFAQVLSNDEKLAEGEYIPKLDIGRCKNEKPPLGYRFR
jgi:hypothetical protein